MSQQRKRRRQRRSRLFEGQVPAGAPLPGGEQYQLPTGSFTRNRTRALALWKLAAQGVGPGQKFSCDAALRRGLVPVGGVCFDCDAPPPPTSSLERGSRPLARKGVPDATP